MSLQVPGLVRPVVGLALWTFAMEAWMYAFRIPDISTYKVELSPYATKESFNAKIPRHRQWPADNYNHLHEQPTIFYAIALSLVFLEANDDLTVAAAWGYVIVRIGHSLTQALTNTVMVRFPLFLLSSTILLGLTAKATLLAF